MSDQWKSISETHGPLVWRVVFKILQTHSESEDCFQDVMIEAYERSKSDSIRNWPAYLKWLAVRRSIDRLRKIQRDRERIDGSQDVEMVIKHHSSTSTSIEMRELQIRLKAELALLPEQQAEAFWLRFIEELSYSEIAEQLNTSTQTVGVLIHRARTKVREAIADLQQTTR